jgi:hypothetical protein
MAGASSLSMMNYLTNAAKKDGTFMGMTNPNIALEGPLKMLSKGGGKAMFDVNKLQWIGSPLQQPHVLWVWHTAPAKTFDDLRTNKIILASTAVGGDNYTLPLIHTTFGQIFPEMRRLLTGTTPPSIVIINGTRSFLKLFLRPKNILLKFLI